MPQAPRFSLTATDDAIVGLPKNARSVNTVWAVCDSYVHRPHILITDKLTKNKFIIPGCSCTDKRTLPNLPLFPKDELTLLTKFPIKPKVKLSKNTRFALVQLAHKFGRHMYDKDSCAYSEEEACDTLDTILAEVKKLTNKAWLAGYTAAKKEDHT